MAPEDLEFDDLSLALEIIRHEDIWDDTSTLASFITTSTACDEQDPIPSRTNENTTTPTGPSRIPTPPPLPDRLPAVRPIPSQAEQQQLIFPNAPTGALPGNENEDQAEDLILAEKIRAHFLARSSLHQKPLLPQTPHPCSCSQTNQKTLLFQYAANLDIDNVISCLDRGITPYIGLSDIQDRQYNASSQQTLLSWDPQPWSHLPDDRPHSKAEMMRLLVSEGMPIDYAGIAFTTPLCAAVDAERLDIIEWLLAQGANINADGTVCRLSSEGYILYHITALDYAVAKGRESCVDKLLQVPSINPRHTFSAIHDPFSTRPISSSKLRPKNNDPGIISGISAIHIATTPTTAQSLISSGAYIVKRDSRGRTPLHWACEAGKTDYVRFLLLDKGFPVDWRDGDGATGLALVCAAHERGLKSRPGLPDVVRLLLERGADAEMRFPQDVSIRTRFWMMQDWRGVYEGIFDEFGLLRKCLEEELARMERWSTNR